MTRMVSPWPLSNFVPDVTLIAFQFPVVTAGAVAEHFPHANSNFASRQEESVLILIVRANSGANPNLLQADRILLDVCRHRRNKSQYQNLITT